MKKTLRIFAIIFASVLAVLICACTAEPTVEPPTEPKTAAEFTDRIDRAMDALDSYRYDVHVEVAFTVDGVDTLLITDAVGIMDGMSGDDPYSYSSNKGSLKSGGITLHDISGSVRTYYGGRLFIHSTVSGKDTQKLYSSISFEDYDAYQEENGFNIRSKVMKNFTDGKLTHREDGTWECVYSGYVGSLQTILEDVCNATEDDVGRELSGIELTIVTDEGFRIKSMDFKLTSDTENSSGSKDVVNVRYDYVDHNCAERITDHIKAEEYTEIEDVRVLNQIRDLVDERRKEESGSVYVKMEQTFNLNGDSDKDEQVYELKYGLKDGTYAYIINMAASGSTATVEYYNGKQTSKALGQEQSVDMTDLQAKRAVAEFISGSVDYSSECVSSVEFADGVYTVKCDNAMDSDMVQSIAVGFGGNLKSAVQGLKLTVKDGKLMSVESEITVNVNVTDGGKTYSCAVTVKTETVFDYKAS